MQKKKKKKRIHAREKRRMRNLRLIVGQVISYCVHLPVVHGQKARGGGNSQEQETVDFRRC